MGPNRFKRDKRESTPFNDEPIVREEVPPEWRDIEAPINFTWVAQDELAGMGWPKSRDQVRFCVEQGIDHLISLSPEKLPPSYAFPNLKWTLIPVEDFTGPTIADIKKFITIMDEARRDGEAIGVHCAEGRGRTGVMCACYLIYYHDIKPWDAIRIMRRQRPGSVERKTQEETVVRFWTLIQDYGKDMLEELEEKDKELRRKQKLMSLNGNLNNVTIENALLGHTAKFFALNPEIRTEKRFQRAKSMPKFNQEEEEEINFRQHMQSFFLSPKHRSHRHERRSRSQSHGKRSEKHQDHRHERSTTPGRSLIENLKPVHRRTRKNVVEPESKDQDPCDLTKHFKDFMSSSSSISKANTRKPPRHPKSEQKGDENDENDANNNNILQQRPRRSQNSPSTTERRRKYISDNNEKDHHCIEKVRSASSSPLSSRSPSPSSGSPSMSEDESTESESGSESISACSSRRNSICSSSSEESSSTSRSSSPYTSSSSDAGTSSSSSGISCSKKMPSPPPFKPKFTVENVSSTTYAYYTRIRTRAAANRKDNEKSIDVLSNLPPSNFRGDRRNSDTRFRRAQTEISDRPYIRNFNNYQIDNKPNLSNQNYSRPSNSYAVDRALSSLRCGGSTNLLNRSRFKTDKTLEYPTPLSRDSWKRTNQRFNYSRFVSTSPETYV